MTATEFCSQLIDIEKSLMKFAYRLTSKKEDAKDLVQDTFLKALSRKDKYVDNEKFKSWAFTIMKNTFVDNYRRSSNQSTGREVSYESMFKNQIYPVASDDPVSTFTTLEIFQNIEQLKDKLRIPLKMYVNGYKYSEIASELQLKIGTVKNRIFLSRKQLTAQLNS
jgi:RNA polymerase sigma-70 factor (ECF subfamily)